MVTLRGTWPRIEEDRGDIDEGYTRPRMTVRESYMREQAPSIDDLADMGVDEYAPGEREDLL